MSLSLRLSLAVAGILTAGFAVLGLAAVRITGETVERELERRIDAAVDAVRIRAPHFLPNPGLRNDELRRLAALMGFELVLLAPGGAEVAGTSLPDAVARRIARSAPAGERFALEVGGVPYLGARARVAGRQLLLLSAEGPIRSAKARARRPILVVGGVGLVLAVAAGVVLAGTVTRPLRRLAERAAEVREGRLDVEIPEAGGREVTHLARAMKEMLAGLARYREELVRKEKMATLGRLSAAVAHELRNPLSSIRMTLEMLARDLEEAPAREVRLLLSEVARLDHSVEELLFHAGKPRYVMEAVDLSAVAAETARLLAPLAEHLGVKVRVLAPPEGVRVRGDRAKLKQAAANLLLNAIQAAPEGSEVRVEARADAERARLAVEDVGPGPPPELGERIFLPFVSGREGGTGLGLSVTRAIARAHGGELGMEVREGRTVFTLELPREGREW